MLYSCTHMATVFFKGFIILSALQHDYSYLMSHSRHYRSLDLPFHMGQASHTENLSALSAHPHINCKAYDTSESFFKSHI